MRLGRDSTACFTSLFSEQGDDASPQKLLTEPGPLISMRACLPTVGTSGIAWVVKLVDTLASGASGGNPVEVQILSQAPTFHRMML